MITAIIVDDEQASAEMIKASLAPYSNDVQLCSICRTIDEAVRDISLYKPQILFLDIELGEGLSFEILERLPALEAHVIFVTAFDHYALKAIKYHAFDYLLKPLIPSEFNETLAAVLNKIKIKQPPPPAQVIQDHMLRNMHNRIAVPSRNGFNYYRLDDIVYIEADGSYAIMHLCNTQPVTITRKVKDFEDSLAGRGFLRVHRSYLVNMMHITELHRDDCGYLLMSNNRRIPLSPKDKEYIIDKIREESHMI